MNKYFQQILLAKLLCLEISVAFVVAKKDPRNINKEIAGWEKPSPVNILNIWCPRTGLATFPIYCFSWLDKLFTIF